MIGPSKRPELGVIEAVITTKPVTLPSLFLSIFEVAHLDGRSSQPYSIVTISETVTRGVVLTGLSDSLLKESFGTLEGTRGLALHLEPLLSEDRLLLG